MKHELEGLERIAALVTPHDATRKRLVQFMNLFRYKPNYTAEEIMKELNIGKKVFEHDVSKLRLIGLLHGERSSDKYRYYLSYEGFGTWLKTLRDIAYSLTKRGR